MRNEYKSKAPLEIISPNDGYHYFFAYYDLQPYDSASRRHLAHRASFADRIPTKDDVCEIGYITLCDKCFHKVAESRAWNFQQGALLQWYDDENIIYNDFREGEYCSVIKNVDTGAERIISRPLACLSLDRRFGLSINFSRVWDFRPGYGYCNYRDPYYDLCAPKEDGIFLVDIENNESRLIIDYKTLSEAFPEEPFCSAKLVVNHITFNPSASRFLFLLRNFPEEGKRWGTILITANRDGTDMFNLTNYEVNSHYHWKNDEEILIYSGLPTWGIYFMRDKSREHLMLDDALMNEDDIHCLYNPTRDCFIGDGYPKGDDPDRSIYLYDFETKRSCEILKIYSEPVKTTDERCDLHNRFNPTGELVSFDSFHSGRREICQFPFNKAELLK